MVKVHIIITFCNGNNLIFRLESSGWLKNYQFHDDLTFIGVFAKEKCFLTSLHYLLQSNFLNL